MAKGATEIEAGIRAALRVCSLEAKGLWLVMRYVIEESDRPGHLRQNGRPMSTVQLAREAGSTADTVARELRELDEAGLVTHVDRCWHAPSLARLDQVRASQRDRVQRHRAKAAKMLAPAGKQRSRRGVLRNAGCNADVTPDVTPGGGGAPAPSPVLSPETPLFNPSPTPVSEAGASEAAASASASPGSTAGAVGAGASGAEAYERRLPDRTAAEDDGVPAMKPIGRRKPGTPQAEVIERFEAAFRRRYGGAKYPTRSTDYKLATDLIKACGGCLDDAMAAVERFVADDWPGSTRHALTTLMAQGMLPRYVVPAPADDGAKPTSGTQINAARKGSHGHAGHGNAPGQAGHHRKQQSAGQFAEPGQRLATLGKRPPAITSAVAAAGDAGNEGG